MRVPHPLDLVPVDERVEEPVPHHDEKGVAAGHHLIQLLILDALVVLGAPLGQRVRRCLDRVKPGKLDRVVAHLVGVEIDGLLPKDLLDRLHVGVWGDPQCRIVIGHGRPCVCEPAQSLEVRLGEVLQVGGEVPGADADGVKGQADDEDGGDEVDVLHRLHPETALDLRNSLEEEEAQEDVVDALDEPRDDEAADHEDVHRRLAPCRVPEGGAVPEGALVTPGDAEAEHRADEGGEEKVEEGSRLRLEEMTGCKEPDDKHCLHEDPKHPLPVLVRRHLERPPPELDLLLVLLHHPPEQETEDEGRVEAQRGNVSPRDGGAEDEGHAPP